MAIEKERLSIEKKRLEAEEERLKLEKTKYTTTSGRSFIDNSECTYFNLEQFANIAYVHWIESMFFGGFFKFHYEIPNVKISSNP